MNTSEDLNERQTLTIAEFQRVVGCGRNQAYALAKANQLTIRIGRRLVVPRSRLQRFLEGDK